MAIIKLNWVKNPHAHENYLMKDRDVETISSTNLLSSDEKVADQMNSEHERFYDEPKNTELEVIQSWSAAESNLFPPEKYNEMGLELARKMFPDHAAWVVTHLDRGHRHNHIVICTINSVTGERIQNKKQLIYDLRSANDAVCKTHGLSTLTPTFKDQDAKLPQRARDMASRGKRSFLYDIMQKADFARAASTSFDDYTAVLKELGVDARVENKNVTYFYGDKDKGVRGKRLGTKFTKEGLMKTFEENDERFKQHPELRERIRGEIRTIHNEKGDLVGAASDLLLESAGHTRFGKKDYSQFTKVSRDRTRDELPSSFRYGGLLPLEKIKKARAGSILEYCERNKIALAQDKKGRTVLKGREFVVIGPDGWTNTKNHTTGSLIEFVALHRDESFLQAIARINKNPRLLQLESVTGEVKRNYNSFYIPKEKQMAPQAAGQKISHFSRFHGISETSANDLRALNRLQVAQNGNIWLLSGKHSTRATEFVSENDGYTAKHHGDPFEPFFSHKGTSKRVHVFRDPFDWIANQKHASKISKHDSIIVGHDPACDKFLDWFLAQNAHVKSVDVIASPRGDRAHQGKQLESLKHKLDPFAIEVRGIDLGGLGRGRGHGPDIGF